MSIVKSNALFDGSSHSGRGQFPGLSDITGADGSYLKLADGNQISDFWLGHFASLLGHNYPDIKQALQTQLDSGVFDQIGVPLELEHGLANLLRQLTGFNGVRFTTSGSVSTDYAIRIAQTVTGRAIVLKGRGGWHGGNLLSIKGVRYPEGTAVDLYEQPQITSHLAEQIVLFDYNDEQQLADLFHRYGSQIAGMIVEPVVGNCGMYPVSEAFIRTARRLCDHSGALLIADEIVTGFRRYPGLYLQYHFDVKPDIAVIGKAFGGGLPIAALLSDVELMKQAKHAQCFFEGGTYSAHPLCLAGAHAFCRLCLGDLGDPIFQRIHQQLQLTWALIDRHLGKWESYIHIPQSRDRQFPIISIRLVKPTATRVPDRVLDHWDAQLVDAPTRDQQGRQFMLERGVLPWQLLGCISPSHSASQIEELVIGCRDFIECFAMQNLAGTRP
ncbi:hypothetical protein BTA51_28160 [Hahella sp. CCB-MM4]|uniref:aminotransferase class III-fold pyridoxal phosphate-dependent enzyme n=1 Tax=Hahella sp. (strain CCB-MM4) TaxID=1926491 RepID=UPI000B9C236D|nr:aminotransferase class III-fold pyridoxal phosphate-dependent enzyme [Hahella sp. CCB-MM4]OZG70005.1 hypothetical protein BTA51_28160 [Hahella sp. CCB-MM4]